MARDPRVDLVIDEMQRRLAEPLRVAELAAAANLSVSRFSHLFSSWTGVPPARFLRDLRLDRARVLLENTTLSVRDVMRIVGCTDGSHFARDYRARHGIGPRDTRVARHDTRAISKRPRRTHQSHR